MRRLVVYIVALMACNSLHAQLFSNYNFKFRTYTTNDGLVHNSVKKCLADSRGFLWIITEDGLSRFDGYQFKNFQHINNDSNSLPVNDLTDIAIDKQDRIWLAFGFGICCYDQRTAAFKTIYNKGIQAPATAIRFTHDEHFLFLASQEKGLVKYDIKQNSFSNTAITKRLDYKINALFIDSHDKLWMLIERIGYYKYNIAADTIEFHDPGQWPTSMYEDKQGVLFLSTWADGLQVFDGKGLPAGGEKFFIDPDPVSGYGFILFGSTENESLTGTDILWVATHVGGVALFSKSQKKFIKHFRHDPQLIDGIKTDFNWDVYTSPDGSLWICSTQGLTKANKQSQQFQSAVLPELNTNFYNCVTGLMDDPYDKDVAWMSINGTGLARYSKSQQRISKWYFRELSTGGFNVNYDRRWLLHLFKDSNNVIWSGSYGGVVRIKKGVVDFIEIKDNGLFGYPNNTSQDSKGNIWLSGTFISRFNPYTEKYQVLQWKQKAATDRKPNFSFVSEVAGGNLFASSDNGLYKIGTNGKLDEIFFSAALTDSSEWKFISTMASIGDKLYLGTRRGLLEMDIQSHAVKILGSDHYIERFETGGLFADRFGKLWIYTRNGVYQYDPVSGQINKFTTADGIYNTSNDPAHFFAYNNEMYIGYRMAYTHFDPSLVNNNDNKPVPHITAVKAGDHYLQFDPLNYAGITLSPGYAQNNISFDFTAIEYNDPDKLSFSYMLEGFDKDWIAGGNSRSVTYNNLPGGTYTFKVRACNSSGIWSEQIATVKVKIIPPFWKTWWFFLLLMLAAIGITILVSRRLQKNKTAVEAEKVKVEQLRSEQYRSQLEMEQIVNYFSSSLINKTNVEEVLWDVARNLISKLGFANCMIYLWNADKTKLVQKAGYGPNGTLENVIKDPFDVVPGQGVVGYVAAHKKAVMIGDTSADPRYRPDVLVRLSELCVPVLYNDELISVIDSEDYKKDFYTQQHLQLLTTIAALMANKIKALEAEADVQRTNQQLSRVELASLRSQMNPHFIFNSLNSIHKYIWENRQEDASEYLTKFSRLVRMILENSKEKEIPLLKEMESLRLYIELEHRRCNNKFDYSISVAPGIDSSNILVPSMIIQPYVENAIWHGLVHKEAFGHLSVSISITDEHLICIIEDDGIGRRRSTAIREQKGDKHRSLGLDITRERLELIARETGAIASVDIIDLENDGGTKVVLKLPLISIF